MRHSVAYQLTCRERIQVNSGDCAAAEVVGTTGIRKMMVMRMSIPWTSNSFLLSVLLILVAGQGHGHQLAQCWSLPDGTDCATVETSFGSAPQRINVVVACTLVQRREAAIQEGSEGIPSQFVPYLNTSVLVCCFPCTNCSDVWNMLYLF